MYLLDMKRLLSTIIILRIHKKYLHSVVGLSVGRARDEEEDVCQSRRQGHEREFKSMNGNNSSDEMPIQSSKESNI